MTRNTACGVLPRDFSSHTFSARKPGVYDQTHAACVAPRRKPGMLRAAHVV